MAKNQNQNAAIDTFTGETLEENQSALVTLKDGGLVVNEGITAYATEINFDLYEEMKRKAMALPEKPQVIVMTAIYKEFALKESLVGVFFGLDRITPNKTDELTGEVKKTMVPSVQILGRDGVLYQCAGVALYSQFVDEVNNSLKYPLGQAVQITHTGKSNRTKLYEVGLVIN